MIDTRKIMLSFDFEESEMEDIRRCLSTLYSIREGEQPLDRQMGLCIDAAGEPIPVAQSKFALEVVRKTAMYEPRVQVKEVTFSQDEINGRLIPKILFTKGTKANE